MMETSQALATTFRVAATLITITCIFYTTILRNKKSIRRRLYLILLYITLTDSVTGLLTTFVYNLSIAYRLKFVICYSLKFLYYMTHFGIVVVFFYYMMLVCEIVHFYDKKRKRLIRIPLIVLEILLFSNPFTHIMFSLNEDLTFTRGYGIVLAYIVSLAYFISCVVLLFRYWKTVNHLKKIAMAYFLLLTFSGIVIQMLFPEIVCELLCEAIGLMGIMVMIEKEDDRIDASTRAYNRTALFQDLSNMIGMKRPFRIICLRIDDAESYRRITGVDDFDGILSEIVSAIFRINEYLNVYRSSDAVFFILIPEADEEYAGEVAGRIKDRFSEGFITDKGKTMINATILLSSFPDEFKYADDIVLLSEAPIDGSEKKDIIKGDDLGFLLRNIEVEKAISQGISENKFHVYYQPIYGKMCGCIKAAQALLKLQDDELGEVNFREFMPIAERAGFAEELEIRMIESVMKFIGNDVNKGYMHIDFVLIHVMAAKVLNKKLVASVNELLKKYSVDPKLIAFDISDTMAEMSEENLKYVVNEFYDLGIKLYLGNYDDKSSGITLEMMEKFDGVILSAWRFLDPEMIRQGDIILKARIDMLSQLGKKILIAGVDTKEYFNKILEIKGDYMSGKYMSEILTKNELQVKFWEYDRVVLLDESDF